MRTTAAITIALCALLLAACEDGRVRPDAGLVSDAAAVDGGPCTADAIDAYVDQVCAGVCRDGAGCLECQAQTRADYWRANGCGTTPRDAGVDGGMCEPEQIEARAAETCVPCCESTTCTSTCEECIDIFRDAYASDCEG